MVFARQWRIEQAVLDAPPCWDGLEVNTVGIFRTTAPLANLRQAMELLLTADGLVFHREDYIASLDFARAGARGRSPLSMAGIHRSHRHTVLTATLVDPK
jgi:hypothetical protein